MAPTFKNVFGPPTASPGLGNTTNDEKVIKDAEFSPSPDRAEQAGRPRHRRMTRIDRPRTASISGTIVGADVDDSSSFDSEDPIKRQMELEKDCEIQYRTCSWQKTAALLFSEYICLAIMSFPYSYSVLGLVPGLIFTVLVAAMVLYTSLIVWEFCLRHPEVKDVCDVGQVIFWGQRWAWYFTAVMFLLNNTFIQGFHCLVGAKYLNTMIGQGSGRICTVGLSAIMAVISWACSLPRTFNTLSKLAALSAFFTFVSVILATVFAGIEDHPGGVEGSRWPSLGKPTVYALIAPGTTFVSGTNAFMNISYTFIGQITIPSFIAEMKEPKDFPKALWAVTIAEVILFSLVGSIIYAYTGTNYNTAPAFGSLGNEIYLKVSFSFMIPTLIFLGVLYASVSSRFVFFRVFRGTRHITSNTLVGWLGWAAILAATWVAAFIVAEVIPFFSDLLSLMSSLFDSFFGFIFWGVAYLRMRKADYGPGFWKVRGWKGWAGSIVNVLLIMVGLFFLTGGTYASVESIKMGYATSTFGGPFSCGYNGL
ncbi:neutral amino acid permease like protein [Zymoseptoria brevis]|uniref:Neutral amino acid permease like protein n=1 Tax=Zymoseptoria brevis TaxID=1047168 RepID=A0A0F4GX78_9PEZI|nr:neutral amino acid permease like protein [Zymoseptoria brevis]